MMEMKQRMIESAIGDSDAINHVTAIIAGLETDLLAEVADLQAEVGQDPVEVPNPEQRADALQSLIQAQIAGDLEGWYTEHVLPQYIEKPEKARPLIGLDAEDWEAKKEEWAANYSEQAGAEVSTEQAAEAYVSNQFGVSVGEFRDNVVNWEPAKVIEHALGGNHRSAIESIEEVRESIEQDSEGDQ